MQSDFNGLLAKSLFTLSKTFLINLRLVPGALKTRPLGSDSSKRLSSASPRLMYKNVLMTVQKAFNPFTFFLNLLLGQASCLNW
jgi:hypothetical protein